MSHIPEDSVSSKLKTADGSLACSPVRSRLLATPPAFAHHSRRARPTTVPSMAPNRHFCCSDTVMVMARSDTVTRPLAGLSRGLRASLFTTARFSMAFWLLLLKQNLPPNTGGQSPVAGEGGWGALLLASCPRVPRQAAEASEEQGQNQRQRSPKSPSPVQSSHGLKLSVMAQKPGSSSPVPPLPQAGPLLCTLWQAWNSSGQPPHPPGALRLSLHHQSSTLTISKRDYDRLAWAPVTWDWTAACLFL